MKGIDGQITHVGVIQLSSRYKTIGSACGAEIGFGRKIACKWVQRVSYSGRISRNDHSLANRIEPDITAIQAGETVR
jgi:hypothetical protein